MIFFLLMVNLWTPAHAESDRAQILGLLSQDRYESISEAYRLQFQRQVQDPHFSLSFRRQELSDPYGRSAASAKNRSSKNRFLAFFSQRKELSFDQYAVQWVQERLSVGEIALLILTSECPLERDLLLKVLVEYRKRLSSLDPHQVRRLFQVVETIKNLPLFSESIGPYPAGSLGYLSLKTTLLRALALEPALIWNDHCAAVLGSED